MGLTLYQKQMYIFPKLAEFSRGAREIFVGADDEVPNRRVKGVASNTEKASV
jgi:hypothetical protein